MPHPIETTIDACVIGLFCWSVYIGAALLSGSA